MSNRLLGRHPARVLVIVLGLLVVLNLAFFVGREQDSSEEGTDTLPSTVEDVLPPRGSTTGLIVDVVADLRAGLTGVLIIDDVCIPEDQLDVDPSLGTVAFRPGPDKEFENFEPGNHEVVVVYREATLPHPDEPCDPSVPGLSAARWSFRAAS